MTAVMMPGAPVADAVFADLEPRIKALVAAGHTPGLATVLVGDDGPSARYVGMKMRKAEELGILSPHVHLPADCTTAQADRRGAAASTRTPRSTPCSCSTPPPTRSTSTPCSWRSTPTRTSTGSTPPTSAGWPWASPARCRAPRRASRRILAHYDVPVAGRHVVVVGPGGHHRPARSASCSRRSGPPPTPRSPWCTPGCPTGPTTCGEADILVAAAGVPGMIQPEHVRPGGVVVGGGRPLRGHARSCPTSTRPARRWPAGSPPASAASVPPRSPCSSATASRPPNGPSGIVADVAGALTSLPPVVGRGPRALRARVRGPPDADDDPPGRRPAPGAVGRRGPGNGGRVLRRPGRRVAHPHLARARRRGPSTPWTAACPTWAGPTCAWSWAAASGPTRRS